MNDGFSTDVELLQIEVPTEGRKTFPMIDRISEAICTSENYWVSRERLLREILKDDEGIDFVSKGLSQHPDQTESKYAANIVDWWSADWTRGLNPFTTKYERGEIEGKAAYWLSSLGPSPRVRSYWVKNQPWSKRPEFQSEFGDNWLTWNLWSTKMLPYGRLEIGDRILLAYNNPDGNKMFGWDAEVSNELQCDYATISDLYASVKKEFPKAIEHWGLTKKRWLEDEYNLDKPEPGYFVGLSAEGRQFLNVSRPEEIKIGGNGWLALSEAQYFDIVLNAPRTTQKSWQVNHNQSAEHEVPSGQLFAPLKGKSGQIVGAQVSLKDAQIGDRVYSMSAGQIRAVGHVTQVAYHGVNPRPSNLWSEEGRILNVEFQALIQPFTPKDFVNQIEPMQDHNKTGLDVNFGGKVGYFWEMSKEHADVYDSIIKKRGGVIPAELHLLLRWSPNELGGHSVIIKHREVLENNGSVVWAKFGSPLSDKRVDLFKHLLSVGKKVSVFLYGGKGNSSSLYEANLVAITNNASEVDSSLIPDYYRATIKPGATHFVFDEISSDNRYQDLEDLLVLESKPNSSILNALNGQQNALNVLCREQKKSHRIPGGETPMDHQILADVLSWPADRVNDTLAGLHDGSPQIILTGAPGTGKTWCAEIIAKYLLGERDKAKLLDTDHERVHIVQFHPTYSYQQFIEGLQPVPIDGGGFKFDNAPGVLLKIIEQMGKESQDSTIPEDDRKHVLIIDEINRANVPSVFGELMYLLEYRNKQMTLQGGGAFQLPENLYIIGTMNSADRSVRGLDLALRRRFDFFNIEPDGKVISNYYASGNGPTCEGITSDQLVSFFNKLNTQINEDGQTSDLAIGHSYFMKKTMTKRVLERIWNQQLHPLIREYFIGNPDVIANYSFSKFFDS